MPVIRRVSEHSEDWVPNEGRQSTPWSRAEIQVSAPRTQQWDIPSRDGSPRLSPALDPHARMRLGNVAKWVFLAAILLFVAAAATWFPFALTGKLHDKALADALATNSRHSLLAVSAAVIFAAVLATGIPRTLAPHFFGRWREAADAFRDWTLISLITGGLYGTILAILKSSAGDSSVWTSRLIWYKDQIAQQLHPEPAAHLFDEWWLTYRLPIILICAVVGILMARFISVRREGVLDANPLSAVIQVVLQATLVGLFNRPFEFGFDQLSQDPMYRSIFLGCGILAGIGSLGLLCWAYSVDSRLIGLHRQRHPESTGVDTGAGAVPLTLTVVGGRDSGKTVMLAAAYYEWATESMGQLRISPAARRTQGDFGDGGSGTDLSSIAQELYVNYEFPAGTVVSTSLDFDLLLGPDPVAQFNILDYPGGAVAGRISDVRLLNEFWSRVEKSDGIILVADMSYARRNQRDKDYLQVYNAYREVMRRVIDTNGRNRVVPVALVLTKCDEWLDPQTGRIDVDGLESALQEFGYRELEREWQQLCQTQGPGVAEFTTWMTSAITYSEPQVDENGNYDLSLPFRIMPPPPPILPTGCASPLLWMAAKVMRWNVTMFRDLSSFFLGSSPRGRRRIEAIEELERIADAQAATV